MSLKVGRRTIKTYLKSGVSCIGLGGSKKRETRKIKKGGGGGGRE